MDMERARVFVYHQDHDPKMVYSEESQEWYDKGWVDSPAKFKDILKNFDIDAKDQVAVHAIGEAIQGVVESANDSLNLDRMKAGELSKYLNKNYGMQTTHRQGKKYLLELAKGKLEGSPLIDLGETVIGEDDNSIEDN